MKLTDEEARENQRLAEEALQQESVQSDDSKPDPFDLALRWWIDETGRRYPIPTPLELHLLSRLGLEGGEVMGQGLRAAYLVWLAQNRGPGHLRRLQRLMDEPLKARAVLRMMPNRIMPWHRLIGRITGRRPYDRLDSKLIAQMLAELGEWMLKKPGQARGRFVP